MISSSTFRQRLTASLTAIVIGTSSVAMPLAQAQTGEDTSATSVDYEPPQLDHEVVDRGVAGESQVFLATVSDDQAIEQVTLFYRFRGDEQYASLPMTPLDQSDNYTATVNTTARDTRNIEYYIEARDASGNRVVQGFVFEPLARVMEPAPLAIGEADESAEAPPEGMSLTRKIVYVALGVLVVGGIAAAIDNSSGSNDDNDSGDGSSGDGESTDGSTTDSGSGDQGTGDEDSTDTADVDDSVAAGSDDSSGADTPVVDTAEDIAPETGSGPVGVQFGGSGLGFGVTF